MCVFVCEFNGLFAERAFLSVLSYMHTQCDIFMSSSCDVIYNATGDMLILWFGFYFMNEDVARCSLIRSFHIVFITHHPIHPQDSARANYFFCKWWCCGPVMFIYVHKFRWDRARKVSIDSRTQSKNIKNEIRRGWFLHIQTNKG